MQGLRSYPFMYLLSKGRRFSALPGIKRESVTDLSATDSLGGWGSSRNPGGIGT